MRGWTIAELHAVPMSYIEAITVEMEEGGGGGGLEELDEEM